MNKNHACFVMLSVMFFVGCGPLTITTTKVNSEGDVHAARNHASEGPHHGSLIELGNEEYHAEIIHDDKAVTIYVLDAAAKSSVPIDAADVTINLLHDGKPEQFKLVARSEVNDPAGKSSRFTLADPELVAHLDDGSSKPKLILTINGSPYRGEIEHDHDQKGTDHSGHDHAH